eukprot:4031189-Alexandrium_andersonii.AAC.1
MADAVDKVAESSQLHEVHMAGQGSFAASAAADQGNTESAATPVGRWVAPSLPAGCGGLQPGMPSAWLL